MSRDKGPPKRAAGPPNKDPANVEGLPHPTTDIAIISDTGDRGGSTTPPGCV
jgi:hypothetical protein